MTLSTSLRNAARTLINTFGNTAAVYTYSSATKTENNEGDVTVSSWGSATSVLAVDGDNAQAILTQATQGVETLGEDEKIFRDDTTLAINDRVTVQSIEYKVVQIKKTITQNTLVIQTVTLARRDSTTNW